MVKTIARVVKDFLIGFIVGCFEGCFPKDGKGIAPPTEEEILNAPGPPSAPSPRYFEPVDQAASALARGKFSTATIKKELKK